jgi:hypothetical protein
MPASATLRSARIATSKSRALPEKKNTYIYIEGKRKKYF